MTGLTWLLLKVASWLLHAVVVMVSVSVVSKGNKSNTLGRALLVTFLVALLVTPFAYFWWLLIPGIIALVAWWIVYAGAYGLGLGGALAAGLVQMLLGVAVDLLLRGRLR